MIQDQYKFSWKCWFKGHDPVRRNPDDYHVICKRCGLKEVNWSIKWEEK